MGTFSEFDHLHEHIEKMWDRLTGGHPGQPRFGPPIIEPPADVYETEDSVVVVIEISGMRGQDVELNIADSRLTVRGERRESHLHPQRVYTQVEIGCGPFERAIALPSPVEGDRAAVRYEDGLLEITLPKRQPAAIRKIKVTVQDG